jgi:hypothetical protein
MECINKIRCAVSKKLRKSYWAPISINNTLQALATVSIDEPNDTQWYIDFVQAPI